MCNAIKVTVKPQSKKTARLYGAVVVDVVDVVDDVVDVDVVELVVDVVEDVVDDVVDVVVVVVVVVGHVWTLEFTCAMYWRILGCTPVFLARRARISCHLSAVAIG